LKQIAGDCENLRESSQSPVRVARPQSLLGDLFQTVQNIPVGIILVMLCKGASHGDALLETTNPFEARRDFFLPLRVRLVGCGKSAVEGDALFVSCNRGNHIANGERHVTIAFETQ
jgi:hypothetical protein